MIKVQSLFPEKPLQKPAFAQTDLPLPKLFHPKTTFNSHKEHHNQNSHHLSSLIRDQKMCSMGWTFTPKPNKFINAKTDSIFKFRSQMRQSQEKIDKIQTKSFKFLPLEQRVLFIAITNYLRNCECSREQTRVLLKKIRLSYFNDDEEENISTLKSIKTVKIVPDVYELQTTTKEVINIVRDMYEVKKKVEQSQRQKLKNIAFIVQRIIFQKKYFSLRRGQKLDSQLLRMFIERQLLQIQKEKKKSKYGQKAFLFKFYQQIYDRYDKVPFRKILENEGKKVQLKEQKDGKAELQPSDVKENQAKKKVTVSDSFIKMHFSNNLRQEVEKLTENTETIMNEEMNRLNNF